MWIEYEWWDIQTLEGFSLHSALVYFSYFLNKNFANLNLNLMVLITYKTNDVHIKFIMDFFYNIWHKMPSWFSEI